MTSELNPYFQVGLDVFGRRCLVIGGGTEAEEKTGRLLAAGADVCLVSPATTQRLAVWAAESRLEHRPRPFAPDDLDAEVFIVLNTVNDDPDLTRRVYDLALERKALVNSYDNPSFSNFGMVALVAPGHLRLGISTSNASPALSSRLRRAFDALFDDDFVDYLDRLARVRAHLKENEPDRAKRFGLLRGLVADFRLEGRLHYPDGWRAAADAVLSCDRQGCGTSDRCAACPASVPA